MIGMNTAIASNTGQSSGVGFAIPAATIARVVPQLIENGRVIRGDIGISPLPAQRGLADRLARPRGASWREGPAEAVAAVVEVVMGHGGMGA